MYLIAFKMLNSYSATSKSGKLHTLRVQARYSDTHGTRLIYKLPNSREEHFATIRTDKETGAEYIRAYNGMVFSAAHKVIEPGDDAP